MARKVLISYAHEDNAADSIGKLASILNNETDIEVVFDVSGVQVANWTDWMIQAVDAADAIIAICTPTYSERWRATGPKLRVWGGVEFEAGLLRNLLRRGSDKVIPVVLEERASFQSAMAVPIPLELGNDPVFMGNRPTAWTGKSHAVKSLLERIRSTNHEGDNTSLAIHTTPMIVQMAGAAADSRLGPQAREMVEREYKRLMERLDRLYEAGNNPSYDRFSADEAERVLTAQICEALVKMEAIREHIPDYDLLRKRYCN